MGRSLQDDLRSDSARFLGDTAGFAIEVMYTPSQANDAVPVTGFWLVTGPATVETQRGKDIVTTAQLQTTSAVPVEVEGKIEVNNETWVVKSVGRVMFGARTIYCHGIKTNHRNGSGAHS